ncbi:glycosyltransferase [Draconibacterium halophilum]|uniref:Glycosyltransferase family 4 protein n=1 Tax=Draconibacterium halophilum TaxID=2706887 RepID=A0A6C0RDR4_9BACT|nr:glycosyltransferase [Draconibacterium halophilum]QIA08022.1 glycosyltransferase family 4 protein [Draconibacterium halophilum]
MKRKKQIIVSVTNDLVSDNRVHKVCTSLEKMGFEILLVGRKLKTSPELTRTYPTHRMHLFFTQGACFYAEYNFRVLLFLLFRKADVLLANDLDALTANYLASKIKRVPLVYDSHEYFTEVPELIDRPRVKKIWEWLESKMLPNLKHCYTVCDSIAAIYHEKYGTAFKVVRNIPVGNVESHKNKKSTQEKIILYQGAINIGRGLEQAIKAMHFIDDAQLVIAGDGDIKEQLEELVSTEKLENKVRFTGRLSIGELAKLTPTADLGLSIEEDLGLNYRFALPNKLFDYIHAGVPVLVSNLPEMTAIVEEYNIGEISHSHHPKDLAQSISKALINSDKRIIWMENLMQAAKELTWKNEEKVLKSIFSAFL